MKKFLVASVVVLVVQAISFAQGVTPMQAQYLYSQALMEEAKAENVYTPFHNSVVSAANKKAQLWNEFDNSGITLKMTQGEIASCYTYFNTANEYWPKAEEKRKEANNAAASGESELKRAAELMGIGEWALSAQASTNAKNYFVICENKVSEGTTFLNYVWNALDLINNIMVKYRT
jgi:hypothetical protein